MSWRRLYHPNNLNMKIPFLNKKLAKSTNFFELTSAEKKKIIKRAASESTKEQVKLLKEHGFAFRVSK